MDFLRDYINIEPHNNLVFVGLNDELFSIYLFDLVKKKNKNILVVTDTLSEANEIFCSLKNYTNDVLLFPMDDFLTSEALAISPDLKLNRLSTLNYCIKKEPVIVICNLTGYLRFLPLKKDYKKAILELSVGDHIEPMHLAEKLISYGYTRDTIVNNTGEIGIRGYVIDVFPIEYDKPIRIEFFDDEIESIRYFDTITQKSLSKLSSVSICPNTEFITLKDVDEERRHNQKFLQKYEEVVGISEYLGDHYTFFKNYSQIVSSFTLIKKDMKDYRESEDSNFKLKYMHDLDDIKEKTSMYYNSIENLSIMSDHKVYDFNIKPIEYFYENVDYINSFLSKKIAAGKTIIICLKKYQINSIRKKIDCPTYVVTFEDIKINKINFVEKSITSGFEIQDFVVISEKELFINYTGKKKYINKYRYSVSISDLSNLEIGDYVVHNVHGIGIYNGIKTLESNGIARDYLEVLYQGSDKIYIPVEKIDLLSKYSAKEGSRPKINKLGGNEWEKVKSRVRKKVSDMADELLKLYSEREKNKGFAFSKDCDMLIDFEKEFPYMLTDDQVRSIAQIKKDMEATIPMDRLLCGDVGFGKTEVAFIAAFKAILDSKQVLFLCPTTILSSQHYENAIKRFESFPVNIALLNRFTSTSEKDRIISGLKDGTIDMVIGTHRLLSDDVVLKDLGLLIVDEEQRFGVVHKEKLKKYKVNVDVLTLTATPIPRTLQMSLTGIRSLSLIETPPVNRYPVQTYVIEENDQIIKAAIEKELSRNGQVFILYNRVKSIEDESDKISRLFPNARVTFAHGQMPKEELERQLMAFIEGDYDVLVCTTIIETGIDIPNVNTLIVIDADYFGLSQLYQLRGRVGRSDRFAYAYFMYNKSKILTTDARKRLDAIKQFTELGSGFSIATRDLSIRGAGDLLGREQAGFIDSVGVDLYLKMLDSEIKSRQGQEEEEINEDSSTLFNVSTHISNNYVSDDQLVIEIHKMISEITSREKLLEVKNEIADRFGKVPEDLDVYMHEELFEAYAKHLDIRVVNQKKNFVEIVFKKDILKKVSADVIFIEAYNVSKMFRFMSKGESFSVVLDVIKLDKHPIYYLVDLLEKINELVK